MTLIEKQKIAEDPTTPAEVLTKLYYENPEDWSIVNRIVSNKNSSPELLSFIVKKFVDHGKMSQRDFQAIMVHCYAAQNPSSPPELLVYLADKWPHYVKKNPNAPEYIRNYLEAKYYFNKVI